MEFELLELDAVPLAMQPSDCIMQVQSRWYGVGGSVGAADQEALTVGHACWTAFVTVYCALLVEEGEISAIWEDKAVKSGALLTEFSRTVTRP